MIFYYNRCRYNKLFIANLKKKLNKNNEYLNSNENINICLFSNYSLSLLGLWLRSKCSICSHQFNI